MNLSWTQYMIILINCRIQFNVILLRTLVSIFIKNISWYFYIQLFCVCVCSFMCVFTYVLGVGVYMFVKSLHTGVRI